MNTIEDIFQQAQLAEAAYADFSNPTVSEYQALINGNFSSAQAADFVAHWKVVDHVPDLESGFSATIFEQLDESGTGTGHFNLAIRGSRQLIDFAADSALISNQGVAVAQLVDLYNFWQRAQTPAGNSYVAAVLASGDSVNYVDSSQLSDVEMRTGSGTFTVAPVSINVSGHSLGGHLAMAFTRLFPEVDANAISVNGLGFKTENSTVNNLFAALNGDSQFNESQIQNVYGIDGYEFAAQDTFLLQQVGAYDGIFIESAGFDTYGGHSCSQMTDSLAVYNLFSQVDASLTLSTITSLLETSANKADHTLESAVTALGKLFVTGFTPRTGSEYDSKRDDLYTDIDAISSILENTSGLSIEVLSTTDANGNVTPFSSSDIESNARTDIAYRYALVNLNPFAVVGADYSSFNQNGELDIFYPATGKGQLSTMYLVDRAEMLSFLIEKNINDGANQSIIRFEDKASGEVVLQQGLNAPQRSVVFGSEQGEELDGSKPSAEQPYIGDNFNDRLYCMGGNDTLLCGVLSVELTMSEAA